MILNRNLIFYACVARGTTIVADFNSRDTDFETLATKCLQQTPPFHSFFSHTTRNKTYSFLIHHPFVYFGIFDHKFEKSQGLSFLTTLKNSFDDIFPLNPVRPFDTITPHCFQAEFNPVFHQLLLASPLDASGHLDSPRGKMIGSNSLLEDRSMRLKKNKKKSLSNDVSNEEYGDDYLKREFMVPNHKNESFSGDGEQHKAKRIWKKQVWVVLSLDLIVCAILFVMWLWICRGFKCIDR